MSFTPTSQSQPVRKIEGIAACLLPFEESGAIAQAAFEGAISRTHEAGLKCAVNMDTGYANYLTDTERTDVLDWTAAAVDSFVGGVYVEGQEGDLVELYRRAADPIVERGGIPILFQTTRFHQWDPQAIVELYAEVCSHYQHVIGFELGKMFAPNGMIFSEEVIRGLMQIPSLKGIKHSSLSCPVELERLALRDKLRPDFRIYTGNDLGINIIEHGSDYLLGLAAFCPEKFAERDRLWETQDSAYQELSAALQHLGDIAFRDPVPAYKHSCAIFQYLLGRIPSSLTHPKSLTREKEEEATLAECALRLGYSLETHT